MSNYTQPSGSRGRWDHLLSLDDFERAAAKVLPRPLLGYIAGAAEDNATLLGNRASFARWQLLPRVGRNVAERSLDTTLFGHRYSAPFGVAPMGLAALSCYQGDLAMARAAHNAKLPYVLSVQGRRV